MIMTGPTSYPDVNEMIRELYTGALSVLGAHLTGLYLDGSLTSGDFDVDSDIDFVAVTDCEIGADLFSALQAMHDQLAAFASPWAIQLEGSYLPDFALRRFDPEHCLYPNIERGLGERLKLERHDETWDVHRSVLRERGIALVGPAPATLIDPVSAEQLRAAMRAVLSRWAVNILDNPDIMSFRGYQSYVVLSLCRILYTLDTGKITSKPAAARWARTTLNGCWSPLIERAVEGRRNGNTPIPEDDVQETLELIRYTLAEAGWGGRPMQD
jgi:hypothetical protein